MLETEAADGEVTYFSLCLSLCLSLSYACFFSSMSESGSSSILQSGYGNGLSLMDCSWTDIIVHGLTYQSMNNPKSRIAREDMLVTEYSEFKF